MGVVCVGGALGVRQWLAQHVPMLHSVSVLELFFWLGKVSAAPWLRALACKASDMFLGWHAFHRACNSSCSSSGTSRRRCATSWPATPRCVWRGHK